MNAVCRAAVLAHRVVQSSTHQQHRIQSYPANKSSATCACTFECKYGPANRAAVTASTLLTCFSALLQLTCSIFHRAPLLGLAACCREDMRRRCTGKHDVLRCIYSSGMWARHYTHRCLCDLPLARQTASTPSSRYC